MRYLTNISFLNMKLKIIDNKEYFECKACEKIISYKSFGTHFRRIHHISSEEYTIKYEQYNNRKKAQETCMKKWGVSHQMQVPTIAKKTRKKNITYDNLKFDSRFEVSFYKFLKEHNVDFTYQPAIGLPYTFGEEKHVYNPDFLIGNQFIELKGLQFFEDKDPNKKMVNPFHYKNDTSEIIKYRNDLMEAKHQCMIKNGVKIITSEKEFEAILCIIVI